MKTEALFYPCIADSSGRILKQVSRQAMLRKAAENFLKERYPRQWSKCLGIPQSVSTPGVHP